MEQLAGSNCALCGQRILSDLTGVYCTACRRPFHSGCLDDPSRCPDCGREFEAMGEEERAGERAELASAVGLGRGVALAIAVLFVLIPLSQLLLASMVDPEVLSRVSGLWTFPVSIIIAVAFYLGQLWARILLRVGLVARVVVSAFLFAAAAENGSVPGMTILALTAALYAAGLYFATFFRPVLLYLAHGRVGSPVVDSSSD